MSKTLVIRHLGYSKKSKTSQQGEILFLKWQLAKMFKAKIQRDLHVYSSYVTCKVFLKNVSRFN